ncbi:MULTISPECIES: hypothetical protein [Rhodanobacter]|uniref:hypothetical protein n=1 Tax=Rhodanobacter TaxID=75309 RepID=UPI000B2F3F79|nr:MULTISPECIES: hypothetical protein [Rhodanobacter]UJJ50647.1 hypothetical protein LRK52_15620 [Rhodanobacter denitrificans]
MLAVIGHLSDGRTAAAASRGRRGIRTAASRRVGMIAGRGRTGPKMAPLIWHPAGVASPATRFGQEL